MFDKPLPKDTDLKYTSNIIRNPVLFDNTKDDKADFYILLDKPYNKDMIGDLSHFIKAENPYAKFKILCSVSIFVKEKDLPSNVVDFYYDNKIDFHKYIPRFSTVIADRRSMFALNGSDGLDIRGFYDIVFNSESWYYNPEFNFDVFPIENVTYWIGKDTWNGYFFLHQLKSAYNHIPKKRRHKKIAIEEVDNTTKFFNDYKDYDSYLALDIETNSLDPWAETSKILEVTLSFDGKIGYYLPWNRINPNELSEFLKNKKLIMQNSKFDSKFLILNEVNRDSIFIYHDTWNGSHVINEMQKSSLKSDTWLYTDMGGYDKPLDDYKKKHKEAQKDYSKIPPRLRKPYAVKDAIVTYRIFEAQSKKIKKIDLDFPMEGRWSLEKYFYEIMMPTVNMFLDVELEGMIVDWERLEEKSIELDKNIEEAKNEVWKAFNIEKDFINLDSSQELGAFLEFEGYPDLGRSKEKPTRKVYSKLKNAYGKDTKAMKKGVYLTGVDNLDQWKKLGYERQMNSLLKYRELETLMKTFVGRKEEGNGLYQHKKKDGRIHSNFGAMLTDSHRNWSKNINLQNLPKHGERAKWFREVLTVPDENYYLAEPDGGGLQLRIGSILSGDKEMTGAFKSGDGDLHSKTANNVLALNISKEDFIKRLKEGDKEIKKLRFKSKGINFQLEFGATSFNFAKTVIQKDWSIEEVMDYVDKYDLYKKVQFFEDLLYGRKNEEGEKNFYEDAVPDKEKFKYIWAVAADVRKKHFETYNGLKAWTEYVPKKAEKYGYVRSPFGAIRRLPELIYQGKHDRKSHIKNLKNISLNSPVQNYEAFLMMKTMVGIHNYIKENNLKSKVIGNVHDSIVMYLYKGELETIYWKIKEIFEEDIPENNNIPMLMEFDVADYYGKGQVWGFGDEVTEAEKGKTLKDFLKKECT